MGKLLLRAIIGFSIGSIFGIVTYLDGQVHQGIGLAILGGVLGMILAVSSILYETSANETFNRGVLIFLKWTAAKNIPGGEDLVPIRDKAIPGLLGKPANFETLFSRILVGIKWGPIIAAIPSILMAIFITDGDKKPDPLVLEILKRILLAFGAATLGGGAVGAVVGAMTLSGVHRRNIILGLLVGCLIGAGITVALLPNAKIPHWQLYVAMCGIFGFLGMVFGLISDDNVAEEPDSERSQMIDSRNAHRYPISDEFESGEDNEENLQLE